MPHSSRHKPSSKPKLKSSPTPAPYLVIDTTLPSNIFSERLLFVTYSPQNKIYHTAFGNEIVIEGTGEVHIHIFASGQPILLWMTNCWHVPSSPHHFISTLSGCLHGNQFMIALWTPRMLFSYKYCLLEPNSPKYVPLTHEDGFLVLRFKLPAPIASVSQVNPLSLVQVPSSIPPQPVSITTRTPAVALHTTIDQPFACLLVQRQLPFSPPDSPLISPHHSPSSSFHIPQAYSIPHPPTPPLIPVSISQPFSSLNYTLFDSQPSFDSPNFHNSTFNPPSEASISILSYPIPTFNPQLIQQPQCPLLSEPLPVLHNFTVPSSNSPPDTPFPIISYPIPTFNPQSIQQLPLTLPPQPIFQPLSISTPGFVLAPPPLSLSTTPSLPHWQSPRFSSSSRPSYSSFSSTSPLILPIFFPPRPSHLQSLPSCSASPTPADFRTAEHAMKGDAPEDAGSTQNGGAGLVDVNISANGGAMTFPPLFAHTSEAVHPMSHLHSQPRCRTHASPLGLVQPRLLPFPPDSRDTLISRSLPLHPPILSSIPFGPFLNTLLLQQHFSPHPIPPRLKTP